MHVTACFAFVLVETNTSACRAALPLKSGVTHWKQTWNEKLDAPGNGARDDLLVEGIFGRMLDFAEDMASNIDFSAGNLTPFNNGAMRDWKRLNRLDKELLCLELQLRGYLWLAMYTVAVATGASFGLQWLALPLAPVALQALFFLLASSRVHA